MKVGKESVIGAMAALDAWESRDHAGVRARERGYLDHWMQRFRNRPGLAARIIPDPTDNPLDRLEVAIDPALADTTAAMLAAALAAGDPPVIVRDHEVGNGHFFLDPCNLHPGEAEVVADRVLVTLDELRGQPFKDPAALERRRFERLLRWPD
jgi:L-seryl-tRNA(Ser) seleniumtransferase